MNKKWSDAEKDFIRKHAATMKDRELQEHLMRQRGRPISIQCIRKQRRSLGIVKQKGRGKCNILSTNTPINPPKNVAEEKEDSCVSPDQS